MGEEPDRTYFLEQLFNFMNYRGTPISVLPVICRTTVDLYKLYHIVKEFNGMVEVQQDILLEIYNSSVIILKPNGRRNITHDPQQISDF